MANSKKSSQKRSGKSRNSSVSVALSEITPPPHVRFNCPAVSIIIPLYNAEKYIGECLDSLSAQAFQNFEVIVVDDCSTDNSVAVVNNYAPKFDGRLKLFRTQKNSGGGGYVPRNIGLNFSCGEYVFFLDADDFIAKDSLEVLYKAAKIPDADVVYISQYHSYGDGGKVTKILDGESRLAEEKKCRTTPI